VIGAALVDVTLFMASTPEAGTELWRTDGTQAGTSLVKDINRVTAGSDPYRIAQVGKTFFFAADPAAIWRSDGTPAGTELFLQLQNQYFVQNQPIREMAAIGNSLLVSALPNVVPGCTGLCFLDLTVSGTNAVKDLPAILPATAGSFHQLGSNLLFVASGTNGTELWRTDGTPGGTDEVADLYPGPNGSSPSGLTVYHGALYFNARYSSTGSGLWRSDGTATGTVLLVTFTNSAFYALTVAADRLLLFCSAGTNTALWSSRGTAETTSFVGLLPGLVGFVGAASFPVIGTPEAAFYTATDVATGAELWKTDGTLAGTRMVKDIRPGSASSSPRSFFNAGRLTYFIADDGVHGQELWYTDGTEAGTRLLKDINPGHLSSVASVPTSRMAEVNGLVFFWAYDPQHGTELWMTDGTEGGTSLVDDLHPGNATASNPGVSMILQAADDRLYFAADDGSTGYELWALSVPPRPRLTATPTSSGFLLEASGDSQRQQIIQRSSDLQAWTSLATNVGAVRFSIPFTGANGFFRALTSLELGPQ